MNLLTELLRTDAPTLPSLAMTQIWLHLGWGVVLAWLGAGLAAHRSSRKGVQLGAAVVLAVAAGFSGQWSPVYWLGLAFQAPSVLTVLLCAVALVRRLMGRAYRTVPGVRFPWPLNMAGVVLGWLLLLDTLALLPGSLYAAGFGGLTPFVLVCLLLTPWVLRSRAKGLSWQTLCAVAAVLLFAALRLPSGNVWDAVLDPWLWLALQVLAVRALVQR
jgi:hypothetical protein